MKRMLKQLLCGLLLLVVTPCLVWAQTGTIEGTVIDGETGDALPGANVQIEGTGFGAATDPNGAYQIINVPAGEHVVTASFVGFETAEHVVEVGAGETVTLDMRLTPDFAALDEIVVIGYGERRRRDVTGSVASVNAEDIENVPVSSPEALLQGRAAGVQLTQSSGLPGSSITVDIRGTSSIQSGTQPLFVIDGVPANSGTSASYFGQTNNALQSLNPNDIESIEVLKDASATAIYGSRAANGVVLITTKTGRAQESTDISFGYYLGQVAPTTTWDVLDGSEYAEITREAASNYISDVIGLDPSGFPNPVNALLGVPPVPDPEEAPTYDYVDEAFREGIMQQFDLSARGGNENTRFYISGTYFDTEGFILGNRFQRINGRVNLDHDISAIARVGGRLGLTRVLNDRASSDNNVSGILSSAALRPPIVPIYEEDENGNPTDVFNWGNPYNIGENIVASAMENDSDDYEWSVNGNAFVEVDPIEQLTLRATGGLDLLTVDEYFKNVQESVDGRPNGARSQDYREQRRYLIEGTANYTDVFADVHFLNVIVGTSYERNERKNVFTSASNFANNAISNVGAGAEPTTTSSAVDRKWRLFSMFSRVNYTYNDRYILEASARADGSSRFSENNQFGFFPSGSVAWRISEENFMESVESIDELKLRVSYGVTGNDQIGTFPSLALFETGSDANYGGEPGLLPDQLPSEDLKWETVNEFNVGLDLGLFDQRVILTADAYNRNTADLILPVQLPRSSGYTSVVRNIGTLRNRGIELMLETQNLTGDFYWTSSFNAAYNENQVTELVDNDGDGVGDPINQGRWRIEEGRPLGNWYQIPYEGVDPETGDPLFLDRNGELTSSPTAADRRFMGSFNPDWTGGVGNRLGYRDVELSFLFQFELGSEFYNGTKAFMMNPTLFNIHKDILDRWQEPGDETDVPRVVYGDVGVGGARDSDRFIENGSYLRLKDITLSYRLPSRLTQQLGMKNARIYVRGRNLLTFDGLSIGDPEANTASGNNTPTEGQSFFTPPQQRQIMGGVSLMF